MLRAKRPRGFDPALARISPAQWRSARSERGRASRDARRNSKPSAAGSGRAPGGKTTCSGRLSRNAEPDIALALDLVHELDLPAQIALARALAGVRVIRPAPAI